MLTKQPLDDATYERDVEVEKEDISRILQSLIPLKQIEVETVKARLYKADMPSFHYVFKDGTRAPFIRGRYATTVPAEIKELDDEIRGGHPLIRVDPNEVYYNKNVGNPIEAYKKQLRKELLAEIAAEQARSNDPDRDLGKAEQGPIVPASTTSIAPVAAGGSGAAAKLVPIPAGSKL